MSDVGPKCYRDVADDAKKLAYQADVFLYDQKSDEIGAFSKFFEQLAAIRSGGINCVHEVFNQVNRDNLDLKRGELFIPDLHIGVDPNFESIQFSTSKLAKSGNNDRTIGGIAGDHILYADAQGLGSPDFNYQSRDLKQPKFGPVRE